MHVTTCYALLLACSAVEAELTGTKRPSVDYAPNVYMVKLHNSTTLGRRSDEHTHVSFTKRDLVLAADIDVRFEYTDPELFYGLSVEVPNNETIATLKELPEVAEIFPVRILPRPAAPVEQISAEALGALAESHSQTNGATKRDSANKLDYNVPHGMTGVDRIHKEGIKGKGVKIAVIDSGVDYTHPALGGCFGPGCKISFGYDLVGDDYNGWTGAKPDDDPMVTCISGGHGTHVLGIIGMEVPDDASQFPGLIGVAPEADFGMYRVFGCSGGVSEDILIASMYMAAESDADIITMSIGGTSMWSVGPYDPYTEVVNGLTNRGIAVVVAAGNDGAVEPFTINAPANVPAAIAVGSVESTLFQTFEIEDSKGAKIKYGSVYPFPENKELEVIVVAAGDEVAEFGCWDTSYDPYRDYTDKDNYVLLVKRGVCGLTAIQTFAANAGFRNVLTYPGSKLMESVFFDGFAAALPSKDADGIPLNIGVTTTQKLYEEDRRTANYTVKFKVPVPELARQAWGGQPNNFSSVGPVWDFSLKPQISAPGGMILATWPQTGTGWAINSGTSMATPYLTGVLALLKTQLPNLSISELVARLQSTAKLMKRAPGDNLSPPVQQGAGLVDAHDAIHYKSYLSPGQLELGPTEKLAELAPKITVSNPSKETISYTVTHTPAPGMAKYPNPDAANNQGYTRPGLLRLEALPYYATVNFLSETSFSLPPGGSKDVHMEFKPPAGIRPHLIPIYNGYISVSTSNREELQVPYMGAAYNYTGAPLIGSDPVGPVFDFPAYPPLGAPQIFYQQKGIGNHVQGPLIEMAFVSSYLQPALETRIDIVRAETDFVPTYYGFDPDSPVEYVKTAANTTGNVAGVEILGTNYIFSSSSPVTNLIDSFLSPPMWDTETYSKPLPLPVGGYRVLYQVRKLGSDLDNRDDWTTWLSGVIENMEEIPAY